MREHTHTILTCTREERPVCLCRNQCKFGAAWMLEGTCLCPYPRVGTSHTMDYSDLCLLFNLFSLPPGPANQPRNTLPPPRHAPAPTKLIWCRRGILVALALVLQHQHNLLVSTPPACGLQHVYDSVGPTEGACVGQSRRGGGILELCVCLDMLLMTPIHVRQTAFRSYHSLKQLLSTTVLEHICVLQMVYRCVGY